MRVDFSRDLVPFFGYEHQSMPCTGFHYSIDIRIGDLRWLADQSTRNGCNSQV